MPRVVSPLYVTDGEKTYDLHFCLIQDTMSELFEKVREKMVENDPSESRKFLLGIGRITCGTHAHSKTTTLDEAGCIKESTIRIIFLPPPGSLEELSWDG